MELAEIKRMAKLSDVEAVLDELNISDRQKAIFILRYIRGWSTNDAAGEIGCSTRTIVADYADVRKKLAQL
jgi:DNA-directed RNA polymerase specialized sigma24 family protein